MISLVKRKIAVRYIRDKDKVGSIYIPESSKLRSDQGIVKYVGPEQDIIKVGDYVVFSAWNGSSAHISEEHGLIFLEDEDAIECVLHPPATEISGLYHKDVDGNYFPATYESSVEMIRQQYDDLPRFANLKVRHDPFKGKKTGCKCGYCD